MDIRSLQYFLAIAEMRSFSKASALMSVTQPALSRRIKTLESELAVKLLHRDGRGISLTSAGRLLLVHAQAIIEHLQSAKSELATLHGEPRGTVTLGIPPTVSMVVLPRLVGRLRASYPRITLRVLEGLSGELNEWLVNGRIDTAILAQTPATRQRHGEVLAVEDLYLVGSGKKNGEESAECNLADLVRYPLILPTAAHGVRTSVQSMAEQKGIHLNIILECDSVPSLVRLAQDGIGYTILPHYVVTHEVELGLIRIRKIVNPSVQRTLILAIPKPTLFTPAASVVVDSIRREFSVLTKNKRWIGSTKIASV